MGGVVTFYDYYYFIIVVIAMIMRRFGSIRQRKSRSKGVRGGKGRRLCESED